jgi:hypothetical protein
MADLQKLRTSSKLTVLKPPSSRSWKRLGAFRGGAGCCALVAALLLRRQTQTEFTVMLIDGGEKKINVIKEVARSLRWV